MPGIGDEKTKSITGSFQGVSPVSGGHTPKPTSPSPFSSFFKKGNTKAKRTIIGGTVGGALLAGLLSLKSSPPIIEDNAQPVKPEPETPVMDEGDVVMINTGHEVYTGVHDDLSMEEAREMAREHVGPEGLFLHRGEWHTAITNEEWSNITEEERLDYINNLVVTPASESVTVTAEIDGRLVNLHIDPVHRGELIQSGWDDDGLFYIIPNDSPAFVMHNIVHGEDNINYRVDPTTGERTVFDMVEIFHRLDENGAVNLQTFIPDTDQPVSEGNYIYGAINNTGGEEEVSEGTWQQSWGWDTNLDGTIDRPDPDQNVETWQNGTEVDGEPVLVSVTYPDGLVEQPEVEVDTDADIIYPDEATTTPEETGQDQDTDSDVVETNDEDTREEIIQGESLDADQDQAISPDDNISVDVVQGELVQETTDSNNDDSVQIVAADEDNQVDIDTEDIIPETNNPDEPITDTDPGITPDTQDNQVDMN